MFRSSAGHRATCTDTIHWFRFIHWKLGHHKRQDISFKTTGKINLVIVSTLTQHCAQEDFGSQRGFGSRMTPGFSLFMPSKKNHSFISLPFSPKSKNQGEICEKQLLHRWIIPIMRFSWRCVLNLGQTFLTNRVGIKLEGLLKPPTLPRLYFSSRLRLLLNYRKYFKLFILYKAEN